MSESLQTRRELIKQGVVAVAGLAAGASTLGLAQQPAGGESRFFPGFKTFKVDVPGATINGVIGGQGPPYPVRFQSLTPSRVPAGRVLTDSPSPVDEAGRL